MFSFPERQGLNRRLAYGDYIRNSIFSNRDINYENRLTIRGNGIIRYNNRNNNKGIKLNSLRRNSKIYIQEEENNIDCSICLEEKGRIIRELSCGHKYHIDCIEKWFCKKNSCPNCRKKFL